MWNLSGFDFEITTLRINTCELYFHCGLSYKFNSIRPVNCLVALYCNTAKITKRQTESYQVCNKGIHSKQIQFCRRKQLSLNIPPYAQSECCTLGITRAAYLQIWTISRLLQEMCCIPGFRKNFKFLRKNIALLSVSNTP